MTSERPRTGDVFPARYVVVEEFLQRAALAANATGFPRSGRDLSRTAIWAGIVAASETIPAQFAQ
jgi:hypothetical protein